MKTAQKVINHSQPRCPYCHDAVTVQSSKQACEHCMAWHHKECWSEMGKCASCQFESQKDPLAHRPKAFSKPILRSQPQAVMDMRKICTTPACSLAALNTVKAGEFSQHCQYHALLSWREKRLHFTHLAALCGIVAFCFFFLGLASNGHSDFHYSIAGACTVGGIVLVLGRFLTHRPV
ncbi:MAG: hypothetical protein P1V97_02985 [Planctomycetota bacterium]|nr:hypothetical protein [Planctomycetota bacterium]